MATPKTKQNSVVFMMRPKEMQNSLAMTGKNTRVTTMWIDSGKSSADTLNFETLSSPIPYKLESIKEQKEIDTTE